MNVLSQRGFTFFSLLFLSMSACATDQVYWGSNETYSNAHQQQHKNPIHIDIIYDEGIAFNKHQPHHQHRTHRAYLEAKKGNHYQLRVHNRSNKRIAIVIAVDGRNILTGKKSHLKSNERMYVLAPYQTATYKGWRTGKDKVNRFYFTSAGDSYSAAWGDHSAIGVIAAAVYNEKPTYRQAPYAYKKNYKGEKKAKTSPSMKADDAGTGFGREEYSASQQVHFRAKKKVAATYFYKYEWRSALCQRGVIACHAQQSENRFWSHNHADHHSGGNEYAPYPRYYYNKQAN
jgi:hypothetical protein